MDEQRTSGQEESILPSMRFDVPDVGIVPGDNTCWMFLQALHTFDHNSGTWRECRLEWLGVGTSARATFHSGMGTTVLTVRRVS